MTFVRSLWTLMGALFVFLGLVNGGRILMVPYQHGFNSRLMNMEKISEILSQDGHEVTFFINDKYDSARLREGIKVITFPYENTGALNIADMKVLNDLVMGKNLYSQLVALGNSMIEDCEQLLQSNVLTAVKYNHDFDLIFVDCVDVCTRVIVDYLDKPTILYSNFGFDTDGDLFVPEFPSFVPTITSAFADKMAFFERVQNVAHFVFMWYIRRHWINGDIQRLRVKYNINASLHLEHSYNKAAIVLANGHFAFDYPRPLMPRIIPIGGLFSKEPSELDNELESFMQSSGENGTVIVSFGSMFKELSVERAIVVASALSRLPLKVIWRYAGTVPAGLGENTKLIKWLPQADLLKHPKTRLFVTHCGVSGSHEAILAAVPVVAIPLAADQPQNAGKLVKRLGMGKQLSFLQMTPDQLYRTMMDVLSDPKYKRNAIRASSFLKDQPMKPKDILLYWVNFVLKYKGAPHLKSEAVHELYTFQYFLLDVIAFLFVVLFCFICILVCLGKLLLRLLTRVFKSKTE